MAEAAEAAPQASERVAGKPPSAASALDWFVLFILVLIWGSTFAGIHVGVETIDPAWLVAGRLTGAAIFLGLWMIGAAAFNRGPRDPDEAPFSLKGAAILILVGVAFTALPFFLYATAAQTTGTAVMAICNGGTPFGTAILAHFLAGDRLTPRRIAGVLLGFLGLAVLVIPEWSQGATGTVFGITIAIIGAMLYAASNVATRIAPHMSAILSSFIITASGAVAAVTGAALTAPFPQHPSTASLIAMAVLALLPTGFAFVLYVWLIQRTGSMFVAFTTYMSPLWATVVGVAIFNEPLQWSMLGALALILLGVFIANRPVRKADVRKAS